MDTLRPSAFTRTYAAARGLRVLDSIIVPTLSGEDVASERRRWAMYRAAAADLGSDPTAVAGLVLAAGAILRCRSHPDVVRELAPAIHHSPADVDAVIAWALHIYAIVTAERPVAVA